MPQLSVVAPIDKVLGRTVPIRFIAFSLVGGFGIMVHLLVVSLFFKGYGTSCLLAQTGATMVAMTTNCALNNVWWRTTEIETPRPLSRTGRYYCAGMCRPSCQPGS